MYLNYLVAGLALSGSTLSAALTHSLHNIHVEILDQSFEDHVKLVYGNCNLQSSVDGHHEVASVFVRRDVKPDRLVWVTPADTMHNQCLHAFSGSNLLGCSSPVAIASPLTKRESIADVADMMGPWFDGVTYMKSKHNSEAFVSKAKNNSVAIVGRGMSGLITSHLLESVGIHNWHIFESSQQVGGRIRTKYLNRTRPGQYQYQEMGLMRFPVSITNEALQIMDHRMLSQIADVLNQMNTDRPDLRVNFIPWIQSNPNVPASSGGVRLADGRIPTAAETAANSSLVYTPASFNATAAADAKSAYVSYTQLDKHATIQAITTNMYAAHMKAVEDGMFHWSEAGYLRYALGYDANITDYVAGTGNTPLGWRTIDQGLESLPRASFPHVADRVTFNSTVQGLVYKEATEKISVAWREDPLQMTPQTREFDYAVVAAPFSEVRLWDLPRYSSLLSRAIASLNYSPACKMALHYKTRFWEHQAEPIRGGCGSVDIPGIGSVCYPSYNINGTGPGVILASYISGTLARSTAALSVEEHVALVQRAMIQVHGEVAAEQCTGVYDRQCWEFDQHQAGAWASPLTEFKTIYVGEHTSYTHAWIFSALDSAVRGTTQLLLDLGLVDEAKLIVKTWMGRWIKL
ncbi:hypothetical protein N7539_004280 [Penicillium diatomitis]|uniref:Amine oxidase domain-containing protein n=1 Tax=Penicillium diatomitis TaxID=2819901 RepID=A0A9W9XDI8_9EURO|nr:uncharacterized protein N7539_004280 [Penicillium diatomitis]KAJ5489390.1 hypothetical protein N7539_004280 [Penicillium diatomitis]